MLTCLWFCVLLLLSLHLSLFQSLTLCLCLPVCLSVVSPDCLQCLCVCGALCLLCVPCCPSLLPFVTFQQVAESAQLRKRFGSFDVGRCIEHSYLSMTAVNDVGEVVAFAAFQVRARESVSVRER